MPARIDREAHTEPERFAGLDRGHIGEKVGLNVTR
jgi:hypothetical protein